MKGQSIWINYVLYLAFAISTIAAVLSVVVPYLEVQKAKYYLNYCENLISFINGQVNFLKKIYKGNESFNIELPENTFLEIRDKKIFCNVTLRRNLNIYYKSVYNYTCFSHGTLKICSIYTKTDIENDLKPITGKAKILLIKNESGIFINISNQ